MPTPCTLPLRRSPTRLRLARLPHTPRAHFPAGSLTSGSSGMGEPNPLPPQILRQGQSVLLPHQLWEALLSPSACVASRPASRKGLPPRRPSFGRSSSSSAWQPFVQWNLFVMLGGHCIHLCAPSAQQVPGAVKNCLDVIKFNK